MFLTNKRVALPLSIEINTCAVEVVYSFVFGENSPTIDIDVVDNVKLLGITIDNKLLSFFLFFKKQYLDDLDDQEEAIGCGYPKLYPHPKPNIFRFRYPKKYPIPKSFGYW